MKRYTIKVFNPFACEYVEVTKRTSRIDSREAVERLRRRFPNARVTWNGETATVLVDHTVRTFPRPAPFDDQPVRGSALDVGPL